MKDLLINVLFILVLLFITQTFLDWQRKKLTRPIVKLIIFLSSMIGIVFCMSFSVFVNSGFIFDIRVVPFIIGRIYGGPIVSIGLYLTIVLYLLIISFDAGFLGTVINFGLLTLLLIVLSNRIFKSPIKSKLVNVTLIILFHVAISHFIFAYFFESGLSLQMFWASFLIKVVCVTFIVYVLEKLRRYYDLRNQVFSLEKMELVYHLSASISHEVRNGLTSAKGFMQLINERETDETNREYLKIAIDELKRTENIVRDFLTFAKPTLRQQKEVPLEQVIDKTLTLIEPLSNMHSIEVRKKLAPAIIACDNNLIQQALLNIFKNAIEAMQSGGILEVSLRQDQNEHVITVSDNGVGMTQEQIQRLGTPYYSTKGQKGTGLGMMVAYRVIKELNGRIDVHSQIGKGTTFTIYLPHTTRAVSFP